ncbi:protein of unknown function (plasmid) [Carnobacterium divergens]|nr:protein of unknown function [Carnobacterium divergens]
MALSKSSGTFFIKECKNMKLKEIDVLEIDKHDLIECITNYQALGYYFRG